MKISFQAIVNVLKSIYDAFLKGRTVKVGGQDVVLPSQKPGAGTPMAPGASPFDSTPHRIEPPKIGPQR